MRGVPARRQALVERVEPWPSGRPRVAKSNTATFSAMRCGFDERGSTTKPFCSDQRIENLRGRATNLVGDRADGRVVEPAAFRQWAVRLDEAAWSAAAQRVLAGAVGGDGLSSIWLTAGGTEALAQELVEMAYEEVRDPDRARETFGVELLEDAPALEPALVRPVEEVEIDGVEAEPLEGAFERAPSGRGALVGVRELRRQPDRAGW